MNDQLPLSISPRFDASGYVYFIRFHYSKDCYKIGSTNNMPRRIKGLGSKDEIELIAYGYTIDRFVAEKTIQELFYDRCNNAHTVKAMKTRNKINFEFRGDINSTEYFILSHLDAVAVIECMKRVCTSICIGGGILNLKRKQFQDSIFDSEPIGFYYNSNNGCFVNYPTRFENGIPIRELIGGGYHDTN